MGRETKDAETVLRMYTEQEGPDAEREKINDLEQRR